MSKSNLDYLMKIAIAENKSVVWAKCISLAEEG